MPDLSRRCRQTEWMDTLSHSLPVVRRTLHFLGLTNRWFGGHSVVLTLLKKWSLRWNKNQTLRILDVGTGAADIPMAIVRWARSQGWDVRVTALEWIPEIAAIARQNTRGYPEIRVQQGDFFSSSFQNQVFDYVVASLFLHHTSPQTSESVLKAFDRLSRRGLIVSDLIRSQSSYWSVKFLSAVAGNSVVRHDGPLSVRRSFRPEELRALAQKAGLGYLRVRRHPWFRLSLAGEKDAA